VFAFFLDFVNEMTYLCLLHHAKYQNITAQRKIFLEVYIFVKTGKYYKRDLKH